MVCTCGGRLTTIPEVDADQGGVSSDAKARWLCDLQALSSVSAETTLQCFHHNALRESMMAGKPTGRPTTYTEEIALEICTRITEGEPLTRICRDDHMPAVSSVYLWLLKNKTFSDLYTRAREDQSDTLADQIMDIGEEVPMMVITDEDGKVTKRIDPAGVNRNRLRVDARKWVAAKLKPRKYGDRQVLAGDPDAPLEVKHSGTLDEVILNLERKRQLQNESEES